MKNILKIPNIYGFPQHHHLKLNHNFVVNVNTPNEVEKLFNQCELKKLQKHRNLQDKKIPISTKTSHLSV